MPDHLLYHMLGSCSRVALHALEKIGMPYRESGVALMRGVQREAAFLAINPKGKVPVLVSDGRVITELPVILYHLATTYPKAGLLPAGDDARIEIKALSDLIWFAGTLQPLVNRMFRADAISQVDPNGVKANAIVQLETPAAAIAARLSNRKWWYGDTWSIADTFIAWVFWAAQSSGFPLANYQILIKHRARVEAWPSYARALARERKALARDDLPLPPGMSL